MTPHITSMKLVIFLLYNNLFIYQVLYTLIYRRRSLYSFLTELMYERSFPFAGPSPTVMSEFICQLVDGMIRAAFIAIMNISNP